MALAKSTDQEKCPVKSKKRKAEGRWRGRIGEGESCGEGREGWVDNMGGIWGHPGKEKIANMAMPGGYLPVWDWLGSQGPAARTLQISGVKAGRGKTSKHLGIRSMKL